MKTYRVALVGCGNRGAIHAEAFLDNKERFELVALCDLDPERLETLSGRLGISTTYSDARTMLEREHPDVFCFATLPHIRLSLIELGVSCGVKTIAYEKPIATSLSEPDAQVI